MPHISRNEVSVSPRHGVRPLKLLFSPLKTPSKAKKHHKFQLSFYEISQLIRSDPGLSMYSRVGGAVSDGRPYPDRAVSHQNNTLNMFPLLSFAKPKPFAVPAPVTNST